MKLRLTLLMSFICLILSSCAATLNTIAGINNEKTLKNLDSYFKAVVPKFILDKNDIYFPKREDAENLYHIVIKNKTSYFYGIFIGATKRIENSDFFKDDQDCFGRIENEIKNPETHILQDSLFYDISILNAVSQKRFIPNQDNKFNIVFFFFHQTKNL